MRRTPACSASLVYALLRNRRFDLTSKRYVIGKVDVTELNLANNDRENNRQSYVNAVQAFWTAYYEIRTLTLYDFIHSEPLLREVKEN